MSNKTSIIAAIEKEQMSKRFQTLVLEILL